ncbi:WG repeat-containing protein [Erythrobacter sp. SDW2]|uniref:WG repeat-containing protein n=1 Tax=Erythrobacter sp. SDW2 TaxID=2907154 RepID=UPI001F40E0B2|nr:WG repeat-containing protein [Erythrobacter sp. SDW2]UIP06450.1 WG repeat-containing protein [Erythrobacter sp. SDW2]
MRDGNWGVVSSDGDVIVPLEYQSIDIWSDGLIEARRDGLSALFSPDGTLLVPLRYQYLYGNDAMAGGSDDNSWFWAQNSGGRDRWIVGIGGEPLLGPGLNPLMPFDGKDRFVVEDEGFDGILSLDCEWIVLPSLKSISPAADNGLALAQTAEGKYGYIDRDGTWVIEPGRFERLGYFAPDGWAPAQSGGKWGFIDADGDWMIPPMSEAEFRPEAFNSSGVTVFEQGGKSGLINRRGEWVIQPVLEGMTEYIDGSFIGHLDGERRRYSGTGDDLGPAPFDSANFVRFDQSGTGRTVRDGQPMIVDWSGREIIGNGFDDVLEFGPNDWAPAQKGGKWGAVDMAGKWVLEPEYDCVGRCLLRPGMIPQPLSVSITEALPSTEFSPSRYSDPTSQDWCHAGG